MSFPSLLAGADRAPGLLRTAIPEGWFQGRTAYGGLSAALALECARSLADDLPPLRSSQVAFVGPLSGDVTVRADVLRRGRNATFIRAEVESEAGIGLIATFVFMAPLDSAVHVNALPFPAVAQPEESAGGQRPPGNFFTNNFDWRHGLPRTDPPAPDVTRWVRLDDRLGLDPLTEIVLIADATPAAASEMVTPRPPISSMTWLLNLLTPTPTTRDGWWLLRSTASFAERGASSQSMHVWNSKGEAVATAIQSVAIFG